MENSSSPQTRRRTDIAMITQIHEHGGAGETAQFKRDLAYFPRRREHRLTTSPASDIASRYISETVKINITRVINRKEKFHVFTWNLITSSKL